MSDFKTTVEKIDPALLRLDKLQTLQINVGNKCNLHCTHCHVNAGPDGKKVMSRDVIDRICFFLQNHNGLCLDITGGSPEMNPHFRYLVEKARPVAEKIMVRTNLTVFFEPGMDYIPAFYKDNKIVVIASLPCYQKKNVETQRGCNAFQKSIDAIKLLNRLGYAKTPALELDLVYNPLEDFLPAPQEMLETDYKKHLFDEHGVEFTNLFTITNAPIGRFKDWLNSNGKLKQYQQLLIDNFNPDSAKNIMCRNLLSLDYRGIVYNCDFNQALGLPLIDSRGSIVTIDTLDNVLNEDIKIITDSHCFCCTAGSGSSCTGSLVRKETQ